MSIVIMSNTLDTLIGARCRVGERENHSSKKQCVGKIVDPLNVQAVGARDIGLRNP